MGEVIKVYEAKTHFSALLSRVEAGEEIVIARGDTPVARLTPIERPVERPLGLMPFRCGDGAIGPLSDDELTLWAGGVDDGLRTSGGASSTAAAERKAATLAMLDQVWKPR